MFNRRSLLLSMLVLPLPFAAAVAQPWWNEDARRVEWERHQEEERRRRLGRHEAWDERREHEEGSASTGRIGASAVPSGRAARIRGCQAARPVWQVQAWPWSTLQKRAAAPAWSTRLRRIRV